MTSMKASVVCKAIPPCHLPLHVNGQGLIWKAAKSVVSQVKMILSSAVGIHSDSYCFQYFFVMNGPRKRPKTMHHLHLRIFILL
ncbi:E3 ubiquitin-protein ligase CHIP-like isoform X1 [Gossypium australe]|uniref:E3 ubiquitin-protein ligase CHIP-like isoform X1 n=1 Tax=Gossypium australe TaxID=47621 RepID=A0A5B6W0W7_9ROSI|nr:E3 ubiquitin-protein ligase CHIP-like isoform X1 [Gossypium australe]